VSDELDHFIAEHVADTDAAIVVDGSADVIIARLLTEGWTFDERPSVTCMGKRVRYLRPPKGPETPQQ